MSVSQCKRIHSTSVIPVLILPESLTRPSPKYYLRLKANFFSCDLENKKYIYENFHDNVRTQL
jgi:hypothetical protein